MTAIADRPSPELIESSDADTRRAVHHALERVGMTYDELRQQARTDSFSSLSARLAWVSVRDLREFS